MRQWPEKKKNRKSIVTAIEKQSAILKHYTSFMVFYACYLQNFRQITRSNAFIFKEQRDFVKRDEY